MSNAEAIVLAVLLGIVFNGLLIAWWTSGGPNYPSHPPHNNHTDDQPPE